MVCELLVGLYHSLEGLRAHPDDSISADKLETLLALPQPKSILMTGLWRAEIKYSIALI